RIVATSYPLAPAPTTALLLTLNRTSCMVNRRIIGVYVCIAHTICISNRHRCKLDQFDQKKSLILWIISLSLSLSPLPSLYFHQISHELRLAVLKAFNRCLINIIFYLSL